MADQQYGDALPRFSEADVRAPGPLLRKLNEVVDTLERRLDRLEGPLVDPRNQAVGEEVYDISNVTESRSYDADATSVAELADTFGTFLEDLRLEGKLR